MKERFTQGVYKDKRYFNSTRNYTLALLNSFNGVKYWVDDEKDTQKEFTVPISFSSYEKAINLRDKTEKDLTNLNFNFLPRLVLAFDGLSKATERQTNKFQKLSRKTYAKGNKKVEMGYNSVSYDFQFRLLLQTRGLTIATQIVEEILPLFNPTMNLMIKEYPLFEKRTETQIQISDPTFEIVEDFTEEDVNIVNVSFDINLRGNLYNQIELQGPIDVVKMFTHIWDDYERENSKLASYYRFDVDRETKKVVKETGRHFTGNIEYDPVVEEKEEVVIKERPDYSPSEIVVDLNENKKDQK